MTREENRIKEGLLNVSVFLALNHNISVLLCSGLDITRPVVYFYSAMQDTPHSGTSLLRQAKCVHKLNLVI